MGRKKVARWKKKKNNDTNKDGKKEYRDDRKDIEIHGGSYLIEDVKAMPEYGHRVEQIASKRTFALNIGYCGSKYQGLQTNEGAVTIEGILERALFLGGGIKECNFGNLQKIGWTRAARTDKGVHAIGQCVSMRLMVDNEASFIDQVNAYLPDDIRVFTMTKTTKSFNARLHCSHRRYEYLLPTYLLQCQEDQYQALDGRQISSNADRLYAARNQLKSYRIDRDKFDNFRRNLLQFEGTHSFHNFTSSKTVQVSNESQIKRFMMDITCDEPFLRTNSDGSQLEWVKISLLGQSFLLNQIRKMIGLVVDITRGTIPESMLAECFSPDNKISISMVPGLGLFLCELFFDNYHKKLDCEDERLDLSKKRKAEKMNEKDEATTDAIDDVRESRLNKLTWSDDPQLATAMSNFKESCILPEIFTQEEDGLEFVKYLDFLRTAKGLYMQNADVDGGS